MGLIASASVASVAAAAPVTYQVAVDSIATGPLAGESLTGSFTFDDNILPANWTGTLYLPPALDLTIDYATLSFDESTAGIYSLTFLAGTLVDFFIGGNAGGVNAIEIGVDDFVLHKELFIYTAAGAPSVYYTTAPAITFSQVDPSDPGSTVPEPAALALLAGGLAGLALIGGRRRAG